MNKYDIRNALYTEVSEILKKEEEYRNNSFKSIMYNEIVNQLDTTDYKNINFMVLSMQLSEIYEENKVNRIIEKLSNYATKLYRLEELDLKDTQDYNDTLQKYNILFDDIYSEYLTICSRNAFIKKTIKEDRKLKKIYKQILAKFKYKCLLTDDDILNIEILMEKNNVDIDNVIKVKEFIRYHNSKVINPDFNYINTVINMLHDNNKKLVIEEKEEYKYGAKLSSVAISYYTPISRYDDNYLDLLKDIKEQYDIKEYLYILKKIVSFLVDDLQDNINDMKQNYDDITLRKYTIDNYHEINSKIYAIKKLYRDTLNEYKELLKDLQESSEVEVQEEIIEETTNIYYLARGEETFLEKDLKSNIREEKLGDVLELIQGKKNNTLNRNQDKQFSNNDNLKHFRELKADQVRVIYRNLDGNNILVLGAITKKNDTEQAACESVVSRLRADDFKYYNDNLDSIDNEEIETRIIKYIEDNKRKGSR